VLWLDITAENASLVLKMLAISSEIRHYHCSADFRFWQIKSLREYRNNESYNEKFRARKLFVEKIN
jgi:hypothetical protein